MKLTELRTAEKKQKIVNNESKSCFALKEEHQDSVVIDESHENGDENCPKILSFDLNEVPAMDEEEEEEEGVTVQSELVMASSSSSSSSYASSQSSVTHWVIKVFVFMCLLLHPW
ncbi:hypothetical protein PIB30_023031 [Stylosanthes scabra]|uniref:Uncharacterized protein n=1 Tax=Stylosanthes scabra TaxID=79078 RepID=A0ABU6VAW1_9FABA|nr:hypothetical protein [Stylosanthes scabra]